MSRDCRICPNCGKKSIIYRVVESMLREGSAIKSGTPSRLPKIIDGTVESSCFECTNCGFFTTYENLLGCRICGNCQASAPWIYKKPYCKLASKSVTHEMLACDLWENGEKTQRVSFVKAIPSKCVTEVPGPTRPDEPYSSDVESLGPPSSPLEIPLFFERDERTSS